MASFNRVILVGNLTRDPKLSFTPSNTAVCDFGMAMNRKWKSPGGESKEEVCFVDVVAYGKPGEIINQYMQKGRSMLVEGRLKFEQWTDKDGNGRSKLRVAVENFTFLGGKDEQASSRAGTFPASEALPPLDTAPEDEIPF